MLSKREYCFEFVVNGIVEAKNNQVILETGEITSANKTHF